VMFRRVKVPLSHLRWADVEGAVQEGRPLEVELIMTDAKGQPRSGSIPLAEVRYQRN
jgi:hypothetical protein